MVRGEVFRLRVPRGTRRSQQLGARYAVVVQADELLALSTVLASPTSRDRLGDSVGRLGAAGLRALDAALAPVLGL